MSDSKRDISRIWVEELVALLASNAQHTFCASVRRNSTTEACVATTEELLEPVGGSVCPTPGCGLEVLQHRTVLLPEFQSHAGSHAGHSANACHPALRGGGNGLPFQLAPERCARCSSRHSWISRSVTCSRSWIRPPSMASSAAAHATAGSAAQSHGWTAVTSVFSGSD